MRERMKAAIFRVMAVCTLQHVTHERSELRRFFEQGAMAGMLKDDFFLCGRFEQIELFVGRNSATPGFMPAKHHVNRNVESGGLLAKIDIL